jgi:hypothetical protein
MILNNDAGRYNMQNMSAKTSTPPRGRSTSTRTATRLPGKRPQRNARWKLLLLLLAGALVISTVLLVANLLRASTTLAVQVAGQPGIQIDLNQSIPLSPYLLGSNAFPETGTIAKDPAGKGFMSYGQQVILGLRSAGVKLLRFPGGDWGEQHTPSTQQLNDFANLLNQVGAEGFMQVQLSDSLDKTPVPLQTRATRAALLVDYMNNRQSIQRLGANANAPFHPVKYWSIGNEPNLLINPDTGKKYTVQEYTQAFIAYSLAMHEKDPGIQIFGPEISQYTAAGGPKDSDGVQWMAGFLNGISQYERTHNLPFQLLNGVSFHRYPFGAGQNNVNTLLSNTTEWNTILPSLHQLIRQTFGTDLPVAITEINTNPGNGAPPQNLAALWWAETLGELMSNQVNYVAFFSTEGVDSPYPLFTQKGLTQTAMLRTMQLFAQLQHNLVPIQGEQGPVSVYATQDDGHNTASLLFINKTNESQHVSVHGVGILPFSQWQSANLTIQGYGMVVLTLHRSGGNEAFSFSNQENSQQAVQDVQHVTCGSNTNSTFAC